MPVDVMVLDVMKRKNMKFEKMILDMLEKMRFVCFSLTTVCSE